MAKNVYECKYVSTCAHTHKYTYIYTCMHACMHTYIMYIYISCIRFDIFIEIYVCVCVFIFAFIHLSTYVCIYIWYTLHISKYICVCVGVYLLLYFIHVMYTWYISHPIPMFRCASRLPPRLTPAAGSKPRPRSSPVKRMAADPHRIHMGYIGIYINILHIFAHTHTAYVYTHP